MVQRLRPGGYFLEKDVEANPSELGSVAGEISHSAVHQGTSANRISRGVMVKGDSQLDQSLQKLLVVGSRVSPDVFKHLVGVEEARGVEQSDAVKVFGMHPCD